MAWKFRTLMIALWLLPSGCLFLPVVGDDPPRDNRLPSYHEVLAKNPLENGTGGGKLWERAGFFVWFPFRLLEMGNFVAQGVSPAQSLLPSRPPGLFLHPKTGTVVQQMSASRDSYQRGMALEMTQGRSEIVPSVSSQLLTGIADRDPYPRLVAVYLLTHFSPDSLDLKILTQLLGDGHEFVRLEAVYSVRKFANGKEVLPLLYKTLHDPSPLVRGAGAKVLGELGYPEAVLPLQSLLHDHEGYVKEEVERALVRLKGSKQ